MIFDTEYVKNSINGYKNTNDKIARMIKNNEIHSIIRGIYTDNINENREAIASYILMPSYLSFEYALSKYQLIPEDVKVYTSATCGKRKKKMYETNFGTYIYYDVPRDIFKYGVNLIESKEYKYFIASPCKALCDKLYNTKPLKSVKQLKEYLFDDLRIDKEEFEKLDKNDLCFLIDRYNSTNCKLLLKIISDEG